MAAEFAQLDGHNHGASDLPLPGLQNCRFGAWLENEGYTLYGDRAVFRTIEVLHREVHERVHVLLDLKKQGKAEEATRGMTDLYQLRDTLLEQLKRLT
jgi:hypothetical protein